jgi:Fe-S oxidoreductase
LVGVGRNNGYLASTLGFPDTAAALARANLDEIDAAGASHLLFLTPADYFTFFRLYGERLGIRLREGMVLAEVTHFLAGQVTEGRIRFKSGREEQPYAYIDPTHAARMVHHHDYGAPRALLLAALGMPGRELFWRAERAHPCGNTALQFTQPGLAEQLTRARLQEAARLNVGQVVTEDPGCLAHLARYAADYGLQVNDLYELLVQRLA